MEISLTWIFSHWALLILGIVLVLYLYGIRTHSYFLNKKVPFIKPQPFVGNMGPILFQQMSFSDFITWMYDELKGYSYGGMFNFMKPCVLIRDPDLIKQITVKDFDHFTDHGNTVSEEVDPIWGKGIFNLEVYLVEEKDLSINPGESKKNCVHTSFSGQLAYLSPIRRPEEELKLITASSLGNRWKYSEIPGERWRDMRSTLSPAFTSSKMKTMYTLVIECGKQLVDFLEKCSSNGVPQKHSKIEKDGELLSVELKDLFTRYTNDVIATAAFGLSVDSLKNPSNDFYLMGKDATNFGYLRSLIFLAYVVVPKLMKILHIRMQSERVMNFFKSLVKDTMTTREREGIIRPDLVQLLMLAKKGALYDENSPKEIKRVLDDDDDLVAQAFLFFIAGFDTTSTLLCFTCHQIATHPEVLERLQAEIDTAMGDCNENISYENIHSMKYLDMVISETLRIYPPSVATDRKCTKTYTLPADPPLQMNPGDPLWIPTYALHHDPQNFPDPDKFDPERFSDENKHNIKPFTYIPFGSGPRICIGSRFALMEAKIAMVYLLRRFNLKVIPRTPIPIKITKKGFNMTVDGGFWMGLEKRS